MPKKILKGRVVCSRNDKTVNVLVKTRVLHPIYKKYINSSKRFLAHDKLNQCKAGDVVVIQENKPISKRKSWIVIHENGGAA